MGSAGVLEDGRRERTEIVGGGRTSERNSSSEEDEEVDVCVDDEFVLVVLEFEGAEIDVEKHFESVSCDTGRKFGVPRNGRSRT